jgi:glycerophosphoryl diester phosphodiesterase
MHPLFNLSARLVIAHRGNSAHCPENTIVSLRSGIDLGADGVEFDVRVSADGTVVAFHDATLERTTDGTGRVAERSLAELRALDAGYRFTADGGRTHQWRDRGVGIPTLEEVLGAIGDTPFILELKVAEAATEALRLIRRFGAEQRCIVGSFIDEALVPFRAAGIATGAGKSDVRRLYLRTLLPGGPATTPFRALVIPPWYSKTPLPILRFASMVRNAGVPTYVWTVDAPQGAQRYWAGGVNGILSNDPAAILAAAGRPVRAPAPPPERTSHG